MTEGTRSNTERVHVVSGIVRPHEMSPKQLACLFHAALHRTGQITIRLAYLPAEDAGRCNYADGTIYVSADLGPAEMRSTVVHELVHLSRGPVHGRHSHIEEVIVEQAAAEALIPQAAELATIEHRWTNDEIGRLAASYGVDEALMHEVFDPQTMPLMPIAREVLEAEIQQASRHRFRSV